jgi:FkbM family methyltransferase
LNIKYLDLLELTSSKITNSEFDSAQLAFEALNTYFSDYIKNNQIIIVDVGAGQPEFYSNTLFFRGMNSKIISIDAMPKNVEMFKNKGFDILHYAVTETDDLESVMFKEFPYIQGLSCSTIMDSYESIRNPEVKYYEVPAKSLKSILKEYYPKVNHIDILDIDTEGNEVGILKGSNLEYYNPKILIIENIDTKSNGYDQFYTSIGYEKYARCAHNDILINKNLI